MMHCDLNFSPNITHAGSTTSHAANSSTTTSVYYKIWHALSVLENDPHPDVASMARKVTDHIREQVGNKITFYVVEIDC